MHKTLSFLQELGISNSIVNSIGIQLNTIFDLIIIEKKQKILDSTNRKSSTLKVIKALEENEEWFAPSILESLYILIDFGASKQDLNITMEYFRISTIKELGYISENEIDNSTKRNFTNKMIKLRGLARFYEEWLKDERNQLQLTRDLILFYFYSVREVDDVDNNYRVQEFIGGKISNTSFTEQEINRTIKSLSEEGYLNYYEGRYYFPTNIYYKSSFDSIERVVPEVPLRELLVTEFKDVELLKHRLDGLTLEETGNLFGITRERVRQRQAKVLGKLGRIAEVEKYRDLFETYTFNKTEFTLLFNEMPQLFELLDLILKKGTKDPSYYVLESNDIPSKLKFEFLMNQRFFVTRFGEIKRMNKVDLVEEILFNNKDQVFNPNTFFEVYKSEAGKYSGYLLEISSPRAIEGNISRSEYVISTRGHKFRYYDYNVSDDDWSLLSEIMSLLETGCYSMLKIFQDNKHLMNQLGIRDEYELHNLYKRNMSLLSAEISLTRSPEFTVGNIQKKDFIMDEVMKFSGKTIDDCLGYLFVEFGHKRHTMAAYISSNFRSHVNEGLVIPQLIDLKDAQIEELKTLFTKVIYMKHDATVILQEVGENLSTPLLDKLGYYMTGNVIFKKEFKNVTSAFSSFVTPDALFKRGEDSVGRSREMGSYLFRMEAERKLVAIGTGLYAPIEFLENRGVMVTVLEDFVNEVYNFLPDVTYFSLYSLEQSGFTHPLLDMGFESIFYERLITTSDNFNPVTRKSPLLFSKGKSSPVTLELFYSDKLSTFEKGMDIYDFADDLYEEFHIVFDLDNIKACLRRYGSFYSEELNKLYFDKETYLNEVYA